MYRFLLLLNNRNCSTIFMMRIICIVIQHRVARDLIKQKHPVTVSAAATCTNTSYMYCVTKIIKSEIKGNTALGHRTISNKC